METDLIGQTFGLLAVIAAHSKTPGGAKRVRCRCQCGNESFPLIRALKTGHAKSCGCLHRRAVAVANVDKKSKPFRKTPEYQIWKTMLQRCHNPMAAGFQYYGARGVKVLWDSFDAFYADMGPRPTDKHSIERKNVNGHYEPSNCIWLEFKYQAHNRRNSVLSVALAVKIRQMRSLGLSVPEISKGLNISISSVERVVYNPESWTQEQAPCVSCPCPSGVATIIQPPN